MTAELPHPPIAPRPAPDATGGLAPVEERRCPDPAWHFSIALPRGWSVGPGALAAPDAGAPGEIALFRREDPPAELRVLGVRLDREVDPADWLDLSPLLEGKSIVSRLPARTTAGIRGDVLSTWTGSDRAQAGRFFATKVGGRLFILSFQTALEHYAALAGDAARALGSFSPIDPSGGPYVEPVRTHAETTPVRWEITLPGAWVIEPGSKGPDVASFQAENVRAEPAEEEELVGKLACAVLARASAKRPREVAGAYLDAVRENEIRIDHDDFEEEAADQPFERSWYLVSDVDRGGVGGELRCRVLLHRRVWMLAGVISPRREDDPAAWMQNKRALDVLTGAVKIEV